MSSLRIFLIVIVASLTLMMCKTYHIRFKTYNSWYSERAKELSKEWLETMNALESKYSILTFTEGFIDDDILVLNGDDTLFNGKVNTIASMDYAKSLRIDNTIDTYIFDNQLKKKVTLKSKYLRQNKNVYVSKKSSRKYLLIYSND